MKKSLIVLLVLGAVVQAHAYRIKIENDTDHTKMGVVVTFKGGYQNQSFTLMPQQEKTIDNIPQESSVKSIRVDGLTGLGAGKKATYTPRKRGKDFNVEVESDDAGNLSFHDEIEVELFQ